MIIYLLGFTEDIAFHAGKEGQNKNEKKNCSIVIEDARSAEEGEDFEASLEEMCNEPGAVWNARMGEFG